MYKYLKQKTLSYLLQIVLTIEGMFVEAEHRILHVLLAISNDKDDTSTIFSSIVLGNEGLVVGNTTSITLKQLFFGLLGTVRGP